ERHPLAEPSRPRCVRPPGPAKPPWPSANGTHGGSADVVLCAELAILAGGSDDEVRPGTFDVVVVVPRILDVLLAVDVPVLHQVGHRGAAGTGVVGLPQGHRRSDVLNVGPRGLRPGLLEARKDRD